MQRLILAVLVVGLVGAGPASKPATAPAKVLTFDAILASMPKDLQALLDNTGNEVAQERLDQWAKDHLHGQRFRMRGEAGLISADEKTHAPKVEVAEKPQGPKGSQGRGACTFADSQADAIARMKRGAPIKVQGTIKTFHLQGRTTFYVTLGDCVLE